MSLVKQVLGAAAVLCLGITAACTPANDVGGTDGSGDGPTVEGAQQGETSDGVKVVVLLHRKPEMSLEEFHEYWSTTHATLFNGEHPTAQRYIKRYVQSTPVGALYGDEAAPYDGVSEIYFESQEALFEFLETEYYQETVRPDELKFIDRSRIVEIVTTEHTFFEQS